MLIVFTCLVNIVTFIMENRKNKMGSSRPPSIEMADQYEPQRVIDTLDDDETAED